MYQVNINNKAVLVESFNELTDSQKQDLASDLIRTEIYTCNTSEVEYMIKKSLEGDQDSPLQYDEITNNTPTGEIEILNSWEVLTEDEVIEKKDYLEYLESKWQAYLEHLEEEYPDNYDRIEKAENKINEIQTSLDNIESCYFEDYPEIYEWWACSSWIINKLEEIGECTLDLYWGRCTTGQSICLDRSIQKLAFDLFSQEL